jgi:hypothetical protein
MHTQALSTSSSTAALQQRVRDLEHQLHLQSVRPTPSTSYPTSVGGEGGGRGGGGGGGGGGGVSEADQLALPMVTSLRGELGEAQAQLGKWQQLLKVWE